MALNPLATTADLQVRGITIPDGIDVNRLLVAASTVVREAAGAPISQLTSTVTLPGSHSRWLDLPGGPVTEVTSITVNGVEVTNWTLEDGAVFRDSGWQFFERPWPWTAAPTRVEVTYTHGLAEVPEDIVDLVCSLVAMRLAAPYDVDPRVASEAIDDYRVSFTAADDGPLPVMQLPEATRTWLRNRFSGSNTYVTNSRRDRR